MFEYSKRFRTFEYFEKKYEYKVRLPLIYKYSKVLTILDIFYLQPETHVLLFGVMIWWQGRMPIYFRGEDGNFFFFYLPSKGRTRLNTLNTPLQEPFILHIRWGGVGGGLSPYSPLYTPLYFASLTQASGINTKIIRIYYSGKIKTICYSVQGCNVRQVNCSFVYSAYILKPVLSGRNL